MPVGVRGLVPCGCRCARLLLHLQAQNIYYLRFKYATHTHTLSSYLSQKLSNKSRPARKRLLFIFRCTYFIFHAFCYFRTEMTDGLRPIAQIPKLCISFGDCNKISAGTHEKLEKRFINYIGSHWQTQLRFVVHVCAHSLWIDIIYLHEYTVCSKINKNKFY